MEPSRRAAEKPRAKPKVLVVDDDAATRRLLEATLTSWGYEVALAANGEEAWNALTADGGPSLAIVDWMMPALNGPDLCRRIRERRAGNYVYLLLLTSRSHRDDIILGLDAGADDYLAKPFNQQELRARLRAGQRVLDLEEALRFRATHDALTNLLSRGAVLEMLERELTRMQRGLPSLGVIMADVDHFKRVNDTYGHQAGDEVLRETAQRLTSAVRPYDGVGRYGGEEILIVLPGCTDTGLPGVAERLRTALADAPVLYAGTPIAVTMSLGAALAVEPVDAQALLKTADAALYRAKANGRNRTEYG